MSAYVMHIETGVPENVYAQDFARDRMKAWADSPRDCRIIHSIYTHSGISHRYSVCADFADPERAALFRADAAGRVTEPGTRARNDVFARESRKLAVKVAGKALAACPGVRREQITHVVTASCTGFSNPGMDFYLVTDLGLDPAVQRYHLGFMGCYAAFPALRMARQFCEADPRAVVLVLCLEFCSLHLRLHGGPDATLANALFADGAACALVHAREEWAERSLYRLDRFASALAPGGEKDMAWTIGDKGFDIVLSSYVPGIIESNIAALVDPLLGSAHLSREKVAHWAVHPGGKAILDKVEKGLGLPAGAIEVSRSVLRQFGNMSSATILFVLEEIARRNRALRELAVCAVAFGPGLTIELAILQMQPSTCPAPAALSVKGTPA